MVWFKVDDTLAMHPKARAAGGSAMGLWVLAGSWSSQQLSGGFVPEWAVGALGHKKRDAESLVRAGLWERSEGGYLFHQWDERQPSREQVEADREAARERQRRARERAQESRHGVSHGVTDGVTHVDVTAGVTVPPTRPDPTIKTTTPRESEHDEKQGFWRAMLAACRIDPDAVNSLSRRDYQAAARALAQSNATHAEMERRAQAMRRVYTVPVTPTLLAKHWGEFTPAVPSTPDAKPVPRLPLPDPQVAVAGASAARESLKRTGTVT